jgi:hypothetical protein
MPSHIIGLAMFLYMCGVGVTMIAVDTADSATLQEIDRAEFE